MFSENKKKINEQNHISRTYEVRDEISLLDPPIVFTPVNKNKMFHFNYVVFFFKILQHNVPVFAGQGFVYVQ